jgi:hypothetical protein
METSVEVCFQVSPGICLVGLQRSTKYLSPGNDMQADIQDRNLQNAKLKQDATSANWLGTHARVIHLCLRHDDDWILL